MEATHTLDPRDPWARPRRIELFRYARERGITEISEQMPKDVIVDRLKRHGVPPPSVPPRWIGKNLDARSGDTSPTSHHYSGGYNPPKTLEVNANDLAEIQWQQQLHEMQQPKSYNEMRAELKAAGVKLDRKWNKEQVKERWEQHVNNASHGGQ